MKDPLIAPRLHGFVRLSRQRAGERFTFGFAPGFTLVELLAVIGVMVVMLAFTVPLVSGMRASGQMTGSVAQISSLLEQARGYAMTNNTYVWLGFAEDPTQGRVRVAVVAGLTGTTADISGTSTRRLIGRIAEFPNLRIHPLEHPISGMETAEAIADSTLGEFSETRAGETIRFERLLRFDPAGGARIKEDEISRWVEIALEPMNGAVPNRANGAAIQIAGLTGKVRIFRP